MDNVKIENGVLMLDFKTKYRVVMKHLNAWTLSDGSECIILYTKGGEKFVVSLESEQACAEVDHLLRVHFDGK